MNSSSSSIEKPSITIRPKSRGFQPKAIKIGSVFSCKIGVWLTYDNALSINFETISKVIDIILLVN